VPGRVKPGQDVGARFDIFGAWYEVANNILTRSE
jgi:hypothetical protein